MQFLSDVKDKVAEFASENATLILTAGGVVGTVATAVLTGRASFKAAEILAMEKEDLMIDKFQPGEEPRVLPPELTLMTKVKVVWPQFIPPIIIGTTTVAAIIMSHRMSSAKIAGLAAAYGLAERNFGEYKDKVTEKLTGPKKTAIDDELAQERVDRTPGGNMVVVEGKVLCFDQATGRYFESTMENIRAAVNKTNAAIYDEDYIRASYFYELLGLDETTWTGEVGWNKDNRLEVIYSAVLKEGKACIAIDFERLPTAELHPKHL